MHEAEARGTKRDTLWTSCGCRRLERFDFLGCFPSLDRSDSEPVVTPDRDCRDSAVSSESIDLSFRYLPAIGQLLRGEQPSSHLRVVPDQVVVEIASRLRIAFTRPFARRKRCHAHMLHVLKVRFGNIPHTGMAAASMI